ncbi:hypothetical protein BSR28_02280 [Boudabousia liubingyangii]|uniref:DUF881 domain-containing protein n=1 Tax=Boudabousia liubingyangii TaxID=1921764 RepID=UPI000938AD89|nr:DUF881 domain-containing protein [Boudabousia liubingyangii]OKL48535.1 hypothetical protein BSR28_02280 [Boudabousia liubingyangii]
MARSEKRRRRPSWVYGGTVITMLIAGLILGTSAVNYGGGRHATDLRTLIHNEERSALETKQSNEALRKEINELINQRTNFAQKNQVPGLDPLLPVSGPGLVISMSDSSNVPVGENVDLNDYVVHQQDIEGAMNALWVGGAEAMSVQGHRVVSTSQIRCVGNVIYVDGDVYSPPYVIKAIGDPVELRKAVDEDATMEVFRQYVKAKQLGLTVTTDLNLKLPGSAKPLINTDMKADNQ